MKMTVLKSAIAGLALVASGAMAEGGFEINGEISITTRAAAPDYLDGALTELISGWEFRSADTQAMQLDDFDNPGMLAVEAAMGAWDTVEGTAAKSCASCHGSAE